MEPRNWLEAFQLELRRRRLPRREASRLCEEMSAHLADLLREEGPLSAEQIAERLGIPADLAAAAELQYRRRSFAARRPVIAFALAPTPIAILLAAICMALFCLVSELLEPLCAGNSAGVHTFILAHPLLADLYLWGWNYFIRWTPFLLTAALLCRWGRLTGRRREVWLACLPLALLAALTTGDVRNLPDGHGTWQIGLSLPVIHAGRIHWPRLHHAMMAFQAALPLLVVACWELLSRLRISPGPKTIADA